MKTTGGKTKAARKPARVVNIIAEGHRGIIAVRKASSLKQALEEYFKDTLSPRGDKRITIIGNVLTVDTGHGVKTYTAKEVYQ